MLYNVIKQDKWGGNNRKDYALTVDTAKKVAMSEQTKRGDEIQDYFIACEIKLKEIIKRCR